MISQTTDIKSEHTTSPDSELDKVNRGQIAAKNIEETKQAFRDIIAANSDPELVEVARKKLEMLESGQSSKQGVFDNFGSRAKVAKEGLNNIGEQENQGKGSSEDHKRLLNNFLHSEGDFDPNEITRLLEAQTERQMKAAKDYANKHTS